MASYNMHLWPSNFSMMIVIVIVIVMVQTESNTVYYLFLILFLIPILTVHFVINTDLANFY